MFDQGNWRWHSQSQDPLWNCCRQKGSQEVIPWEHIAYRDTLLPPRRIKWTNG